MSWLLVAVLLTGRGAERVEVVTDGREACVALGNALINSARERGINISTSCRVQINI